MSWINEYVQMIGCVNPADLQIEKAQQLKIRNLPENLYRYRHATDYAISNFESDTVWLSKPSAYNDPFEFWEYLDYSKFLKASSAPLKDEVISEMIEHHPVPAEIVELAKNSDDFIQIIAEYQLKTYNGYDQAYISKIMDAASQWILEKTFDAHKRKTDSIQDKMKVCSFCESSDQLLMWSHYSDCYRGFCVEYNIGRWLPDDIRKRLLYPVIYQEELFDSTCHVIQSLNGQSFNNLYPILSGTTKAREWSYEKEWRFIFNIGESFPEQNYRMDSQSAIYIGFRMPEAKKNRIIEICQSKGIQAYLVSPSYTRYKIERKIITQ